jgi:hypothetical protein
MTKILAHQKIGATSLKVIEIGARHFFDEATTAVLAGFDL